MQFKQFLQQPYHQVSYINLIYNILIMILSRKIFQKFSLQSGRLFLWEKAVTPKQVKLSEEVLKVACGPSHTVIVSQTGKVYSFGNNEYGQLGHGNKGKVQTPQLIQFFEKNNIKAKDAVCGQRHTLVLDQNGQIYSFGYGGKDRGMFMNLFMNPTGPLGHGTHATCTKPTKVRALQNKNIQRITAGRQFNTVIDSEGEVYNWGNGQYGAFGDGKNKNYGVPIGNQYFKYLKQQQKIVIKKVKSCQSYSIALLSDGKLYGWGSNQSGQMGVKSQIGIEIYETVNFPTQVIREGYENQKVVNFDISENTLLFQLTNGELWWAGMKIAYKPQKVRLDIPKPKLFAAGSRSFAVVDEQNNIFTNLEYVKIAKGAFNQNLLTGIKKSNGKDLFGGDIVGIGGQYDTRYAIVK